MNHFSRLVRVRGWKKPERGPAKRINIYGEPIPVGKQFDFLKISQAWAYDVTNKSIQDHWAPNFSTPKRMEAEENIVNINKFLSPLPSYRVGAIRCLGLNYKEHAKESNLPIPERPTYFYKPPTALNNPFADVYIPKIAQTSPESSIDYEGELVMVIAKDAYNVSPKQAMNYVAGYTVGNDVSNRQWQFDLGGGQWSMGKGFDTWAPIGPAIVSARIITDPNKLRIKTMLNGEIVQDSSTEDMIFKVPEIISHLSQGTTLKTGSLIFTGTPQGVGMARHPRRYIKHGDVVEVNIEGIGSIKNKFVFEGAKELVDRSTGEPTLHSPLPDE